MQWISRIIPIGTYHRSKPPSLGMKPVPQRNFRHFRTPPHDLLKTNCQPCWQGQVTAALAIWKRDKCLNCPYLVKLFAGQRKRTWNKNQQHCPQADSFGWTLTFDQDGYFRPAQGMSHSRPSRVKASVQVSNLSTRTMPPKAERSWWASFIRLMLMVDGKCCVGNSVHHMA